MSMSVNIEDEFAKDTHAALLSLPDSCPVCSERGQPGFVLGTLNNATDAVHVIFRCPVVGCRGLYLAVYDRDRSSGRAVLRETALSKYVKSKPFPNNIQGISPDFCTIYNQSLIAEENGLSQICGPGYGKALEFLVKDFLVKTKFEKDSPKQQEVKSNLLGKVIHDFVDNERIKQCASRAAWLRNDETHYLRKWADKDINDLKSLISITVNYIDSEIEAAHYLKEMPVGK